MKAFEAIAFDLKGCKAQLKKFRKLLKDRPDLDEAKDVLLGL
jgi:hypothetical protein